LIEHDWRCAKISKDGKKWEVPEGKRAPAPGFESYVGMTLMPFARFAEGSPAASYERRQLQIEGQDLLGSAFESPCVVVVRLQTLKVAKATTGSV
jgi:hypothetical protein